MLLSWPLTRRLPSLGQTRSKMCTRRGEPAHRGPPAPRQARALHAATARCHNCRRHLLTSLRGKEGGGAGAAISVCTAVSACGLSAGKPSRQWWDTTSTTSSNNFLLLNYRLNYEIWYNRVPFPLKRSYGTMVFFPARILSKDGGVIAEGVDVWIAFFRRRDQIAWDGSFEVPVTTPLTHHTYRIQLLDGRE